MGFSVFYLCFHENEFYVSVGPMYGIERARGIPLERKIILRTGYMLPLFHN